VWAKRLEAGTFQFPDPAGGGAGIEVRATDPALILGGVDLRPARRRKRYARPTPA
jgi:transposase